MSFLGGAAGAIRVAHSGILRCTMRWRQSVCHAVGFVSQGHLDSAARRRRRCCLSSVALLISVMGFASLVLLAPSLARTRAARVFGRCFAFFASPRIGARGYQVDALRDAAGWSHRRSQTPTFFSEINHGGAGYSTWARPNIHQFRWAIEQNPKYAGDAECSISVLNVVVGTYVRLAPM